MRGGNSVYKPREAEPFSEQCIMKSKQEASMSEGCQGVEREWISRRWGGGGGGTHKGRVRHHKKGELANTGATQEVIPSSRGDCTRGRREGEEAGQG